MLYPFAFGAFLERGSSNTTGTAAFQLTLTSEIQYLQVVTASIHAIAYPFSPTMAAVNSDSAVG